MSEAGIDPLLLYAWLSARSLVRGLPAPVPDRGGHRVDTGSDEEVRRWVFPQVSAGLVELARSIREPRHLLKLCGTADELRSVLPDGWRLHAPGYFMLGSGTPTEWPMAAGYKIETKRTCHVIEVRVMAGTGALAASGYAAETANAFVYDRIVTAPEHRRKGLGSAVMATLGRTKREASAPELLVATQEGRAFYEALGWRMLSPYSTASISEG